ncbi:hypothetical protein [Microbacterium radiodurans]|uniref:Uncharacterized protein n=1 Tax=Microbacterium radiodurans TaxID=661398 RepID=A0A5J5IXP4_9MICO|nr:hypothetical protein [Microbacterium radiodurans]KAA9089330.1 hypothetical protein F6B42_02270 [Microbacterium radiodurans]
MNRTLNVARMQLVNRQTFVWVPLLILVGAYLITLALFVVLRATVVDGDGPMIAGSAQAPLWYFAVIGAQALTLTFPFSQAMSVTRREFYLGTLLVAAGASAVMAVLFVIGGLLESATNGWGMNGYVFRIDWLWVDGPLLAGILYFGLAMLFFVIGFVGATIYKRAGTLVLTIVVLALGALLIAAVWVIGTLDAWEAVFRAIADGGPVGLAVAVLVSVVVLAGVSFPVLRRATP